MTENVLVVCDNCGCLLHGQTNMRGQSYWASNSGNAYCVWPIQHMRHQVAVHIRKVSLGNGKYAWIQDSKGAV